MDLHVYALLKRKYNDLAESVEGLVDESAELTEEARKTLAEAQDKLDEIKPLLETSKDNVKISEEQIAKVQEMLDELEPAVADIEAIIKQALQNVHTGEYESDREYLKGNETLYIGSTYRALEDVTGVLPTDTSKWQLVAQRGVDGEGAVSSVNNIAPDESGNVDLGKITADWDDLEGKPEVLEGLGDEGGKLTYKGEEVGEKLIIGKKTYTSDGVTKIYKTEHPIERYNNRVMVFVSGVMQSSGKNYAENDNDIAFFQAPVKGVQIDIISFSGDASLLDSAGDGGVSLEEVNSLIEAHSKIVASDVELGHVKVGEGININSEGVISVDNNVDLSDYVNMEKFNEHTSKVGNKTSHGHVLLSDTPDAINDASKGVAVTPKALEDVRELAEKAFMQASSAKEAMYSGFMKRVKDDEFFKDFYLSNLADEDLPEITEESPFEDFMKVYELFDSMTGKVVMEKIRYDGNSTMLDTKGFSFESIEVTSRDMYNPETMITSGAILRKGMRTVVDSTEETKISYPIDIFVQDTSTTKLVNTIIILLDYFPESDSWIIRQERNIQDSSLVMNFTFLFKEKDFYG